MNARVIYLSLLVPLLFCWLSIPVAQSVVIFPQSASIQPLQTVQTLPQIVAGDSHTCLLTRLGSMQCWGSNRLGQLGDGTKVSKIIPVVVTGLKENVNNIAAGSHSTCAVTNVGSVYCWGGEAEITQPQPISELGNDVSIVAAGQSHHCALMKTGVVNCWGANHYGQLGNGVPIGYSSSPIEVQGLKKPIVALASGAFHVCALNSEGGVQCWGSNEYGQLGNGSATHSAEPVAVVGLESNVQSIASFSYHICAILRNQTLRCWGHNRSSQLGNGTWVDQTTPVEVTGIGDGVRAVATGSQHTCAITIQNSLKCWGQNHIGQLGDGSMKDQTQPVTVSGLEQGVVAVAAGAWHSCAVIEHSGIDRVSCWGSNQSTQLGKPAIAYTETPVAVSGLSQGVSQIVAGYDHHCARKQDGSVVCWGDNNYGQLASGLIAFQDTPKVVQGLDSKVTAITAGNWRTCALLDTAAVQCWGWRNSTTSEIQQTPTKVNGLANDIQAIEAGSEQFCAITQNGAVTCWANEQTPTLINGLEREQVAIALGDSHGCALNRDGGVRCWGQNTSGQLGDGTTEEKTTPVQVSGLVTGVIALTAGSAHSCALLNSGRVQCWGANSDGQLGDGSTEEHHTPVMVTDVVSNTIAIDAGGTGSCALSKDAVLQCWGSKKNAQLDALNANHDIKAMAIGGSSCVLTASGSVNCWGNNFFGQLGDGSQMSDQPIEIRLYTHHTFIPISLFFP